MIDYNAEDRTFDCLPSLNDEQVVDFCRDGYLLLRGVVPEDTNRRTLDWLNGERPAEPVAIPPGMTADDLQRIRDSHEPSSIFLEEWFLRDVLLNEQLVGVMRSLQGAQCSSRYWLAITARSVRSQLRVGTTMPTASLAPS